MNTLKGIRIIDENTIEVYTDFWHFDSGEIASWGSVWSSMPWEIMAAMEQIVVDGKSSFSRTESITKNINWLSLIIPNDANQVKMQLNNFEENEHIPDSLNNLIHRIIFRISDMIQVKNGLMKIIMQ